VEVLALNVNMILHTEHIGASYMNTIELELFEVERTVTGHEQSKLYMLITQLSMVKHS